MPPQPLATNQRYDRIIFGTGALRQRPELAISVLSTVEARSSADSHFLGILAYLVGLRR